MAAVTAALLLAAAGARADESDGPGRYLGTDEFLALAFGTGEPPAADTFWITAEHRAPLERLIGHRFPALRVRYWRDGDRTAWILEEIGKEEPITIGVVVENGAIRDVRILEFREVRGWEVRYPFFTDQFQDASLTGEGELDRHIDGITGATLSVGAVKRMARAALYLHAQVVGE